MSLRSALVFVSLTLWLSGCMASRKPPSTYRAT